MTRVEKLEQEIKELTPDELAAFRKWFHERESAEADAKIVLTKQDIFSMIQANQSRLKELGVAKLGLFGSYVRGEQRPESDIDLLVQFVPGKKTFDAFMDLCFFLEEILQRKVEVVTVESLSPYIGPHILKEVEYVEIAA
jgi:uncharacterized protein